MGLVPSNVGEESCLREKFEFGVDSRTDDHCHAGISVFCVWSLELVVRRLAPWNHYFYAENILISYAQAKFKLLSYLGTISSFTELFLVPLAMRVYAVMGWGKGQITPKL